MLQYFRQAKKDTLSYLKPNRRSIITAIILPFIGFAIYFRWQGLEAMKTEVIVFLAFMICPYIIFVIGLFLYNLARAPGRIIKDLNKTITDLQGQLDYYNEQMMLRTFSYDSPLLEHLDREMDIDISSFEQYKNLSDKGIIIVVHVLITNRSNNPRNIRANMHYEFRAKDKKEATGMPFAPYEPPNDIVKQIVAKLENEQRRSVGDYLKFPLKINPTDSLKGFMLFACYNENFEKYEKENKPFIDTRIYFEWDNLITREHFRKNLL